MLIEDLKFSDDTPIEFTNGVEDFIKKVDISYDINYFLDLIIEKGGQNKLSCKEQQRLWELSKK